MLIDEIEQKQIQFRRKYTEANIIGSMYNGLALPSAIDDDLDLNGDFGSVAANAAGYVNCSHTLAMFYAVK